ncbi:MAG: ATP-grasp domain-containing protein [Planctomycetaceae bacterium]
MSGKRLLALGPSEGWHADELRCAARKRDCEIVYADYESLRGRFDASGNHVADCAAGELRQFEAVICRTMPIGSMEQILFRLAVLHAAVAQGIKIINPPRTLETAIDKYATLAIVAALGHPVPETIVVQSRAEAMRAFEALGGDVVVKPIFGGEGRGVMRLRDPQLAWTAFSTLQQLASVLYVQRFIPPGGRDTRMLILGDEIVGIRRTADHDFRTNVAGGASCEAIPLAPEQQRLARSIASAMNLCIGSVDLIDHSHGPSMVLEVNGVPGWKGAQQCLPFRVADKMIAAILSASQS